MFQDPSFESSRFISKMVELNRKNLMATIQAYFDESGQQGDCPYTVFAGAVASDKEWAAMSVKWKAALEDAGISALHMVDIMHCESPGHVFYGREPERDSLLLHLADILQSSIPRILPEADRKRYEKTNYPLFEACVNSVLNLSELGPEDTLHFYFDLSEEYAVKFLQLYLRMKKGSAFLRSKCALVGFGNHRIVIPLQAADLLAYCHYQQHMSDTRKPLPVIENMLTVLAQGGCGRSGNLEYDPNAELGLGRFQPEDEK